MLPTTSRSTVTDALATRWTRARNGYELSSLPDPALDSTFESDFDSLLALAPPLPSEAELDSLDAFESELEDVEPLPLP